jgi:alginate O-acetyltransferase complex protein AlgI
MRRTLGGYLRLSAEGLHSGASNNRATADGGWKQVPSVLFPTVEFGLFFLLVFAVSWLLRGRHGWRKWFLLLASYLFYACWDWRFTGLLLASSLVTYGLGRAIGGAEEPGKRRRYLLVGLAWHLGLLGFFKYYGFFVTSLDALLTRLGASVSLPFLQVVLPVGISFFTFNAIGYLADVAQRQTKACRSALDLMLFIAFFPQLVAGPINRSGLFLPQLEKTPDPDAIPAGRALLLIAGGLAKKVIVANYLATELVDPFFSNPAGHHGLEALLAVYGYAVQIYCDFSAYTDIAIGVALLLGFRLPENFLQPYRSQSVTEFWRRWHISLSSWLQAYVFTPVTKRLVKSRIRKHRQLTAWVGTLVTFLACGLWHGAAWTFVFWGALHGIVVGIERVLRQRFGTEERKLPWKALAVVLTFHFICATWVLFRAASFPEAVECFAALGRWGGSLSLVTPAMLALLALGLGMHFVPASWREAGERWFTALPLPAQGLAFGVVLTAIGAAGPDGVAPFIYFRF